MSQDTATMSDNGAETAPKAVNTCIPPSSNGQPPTVDAKDHDTNKKTMTLDRKKAMDILAHRKMLLERMQLCRKATEARLNLYAKGGGGTANNATPQPPSIDKGEALIASRKKKFASKEEEIQTHKDLSMYAMNFIVKKTPPAKAAVPAPRNISLRTGATVGNKMKAAVATLTTNVGWISDGSSSSNAQVNHNLPASFPRPAAGSSHANLKNGAVPVTSSGNVPLHQSIPPTNGLQSAAIPTASAAAAAQSSMAMPAPKTNIQKLSSSNVATPGKHIKKKNNQSGKKRTGKHVRSGSMTTSEIPPAAHKPLHHGLMGPKGMTGNGREYSSYPSRVLCPETERLRRKRRDLVMKLDNLMRTTYADTLAKEDSNPVVAVNGRQIQKRVQFDDNPYSNGKKLSWKSFMGAESAPCLLPEKRKTQWDYVLEEMRWLATDFVEENKWQRASAKTLSVAVMSHHLEAAAKAKLLASKQSKSSTASSEKKKEDALFADVELIEIQKAGTQNATEDESMEEYSDSESVTDERVSNLEFVDPTEEDVKSTRLISTAINALVENHWELTSAELGMPPSDEQVAVAYARYRKLRQSESIESHKSGVNASRQSSDSKVLGYDSSIQTNQLSFDEMEKQTQICREKINTTKTGLTDAYDDFDSDISHSLKDTDLEMQEYQMGILQFTEAMWKDDSESSSITGSVITGPFGCGKTFSTGVLLWRRRGKGPQLLFCPAASLVS